MSVRTFIAVPLSSEIIDRISRIRDIVERQINELGEDVSRNLKLVKPQNYHITLKFIGDVKMTELGEISNALYDAASDIPQFDISVSGFGGLPRIEKPRVLYVSVTDETDTLKAVSEKLDQGISDAMRDHKRFVPHATFMRIKHKKGWERLRPCFDGLWGEYFGEERVRYIDLMESELRPSGPVYTRLDRVKLV